ncbi:hypothetical protein DVH05_004575 [Phytophthora capsici]|nr:hypothetical protein DVH05_004575 [Phytophthora capsici]
MATGVDIMQCWGFLEPWLHVVRRHLLRDIHQRQQSPFEPAQLCVCLTLPAAQDEAQMTLEGFKLLAAVAHVDYNAWKNLRLTLGGTTLGERWNQETDNGTIVRFHLTIRKNYGSVQDLVQMCGVHQHDQPRREYSEALARIAAMDSKHDAKRRGVDIPVLVEVFFDQDVSPRELLKFQDTEKILRCKWKENPLPPVQPGGFRCTFLLAGVNAYLRDYAIQSGLDVATKMQQLIYENVWFSKILLRLDFGHKVTRMTKEVHGTLLAIVFGRTRRSNESAIQCWGTDNDTSRIRQQVDHLSIDPVGQSRNEMEAICSAAIHSQTVRTLELFYKANSDDSVHWWKWIAYAFFSKRARTFSSLEGLALKSVERMSTADIKAFCGILTSENPEEELLGSGLEEATLTANSPIRWDFDGKPVVQSDIVQFPFPILFVWIMSTSEQTEWVDALVPGYGRCQVPRRKLIFNDPVKRTTSGTDLTALEIHFGCSILYRDLSGLPHFFDAVGSTLKMLTIDADDVGLEMVLERCPNLEKLCLRERLNTAIFCFSEYQAAGSPVPVFRFRFDDILAYTEELTNPESDLTKCLQHLTIHPYDSNIYQDDGASVEEFEALLKMLENNGRLEHLQFKSEPTKYAERFRRFHLQPIDRSVKLDSQSKIAFLSLLSTTYLPQSDKRQYQSRDKRRNWEHFDANILTNVFQFAAAPVLRKVYVKNAIYSSY